MSQTSFAMTALRLGAVLALMVGALFAMRRVNRRGARHGRAAGGHVEVVSRTPLGRSASLVVVKVNEQLITLAVTDYWVTRVAVEPEAAPAVQVSTTVNTTQVEPVVDLRSMPMQLDEPSRPFLDRLRDLTVR